MVSFLFVISLSNNQLELTSEDEVSGDYLFICFVCLVVKCPSQQQWSCRDGQLT